MKSFIYLVTIFLISSVVIHAASSAEILGFEDQLKQPKKEPRLTQLPGTQIWFSQEFNKLFQDEFQITVLTGQKIVDPLLSESLLNLITTLNSYINYASQMGIDLNVIITAPGIFHSDQISYEGIKNGSENTHIIVIRPFDDGYYTSHISPIDIHAILLQNL